MEFLLASVGFLVGVGTVFIVGAGRALVVVVMVVVVIVVVGAARPVLVLSLLLFGLLLLLVLDNWSLWLRFDGGLLSSSLSFFSHKIKLN